MKAVLFATLFIAACFAVQTEEEAISLIHKIDTKDFGRTLLDTVYMELKAGGPLETVLETLHDLEDRYIAEQKEDDAQNYAFQEACNADIAAYDKDIAESDTERIQYEAKLEGDLYPRRAIMTGVVNSKTKEVADYQAKLDALDAQRAEEAAEFEQIVREHEEATAIITEVRRLFEDEFAHDSFLQMKKVNTQSMSLIQKKLHDGARRTRQFKHKRGFGAIMQILASVASRAQQLADTDNLNRIVTLCNQLLDKIAESLDLERFAEDKRIEAYKASRRLLVLNLTGARTDLANAQTELNSINDQITQTETSLENTNLRIGNLSEARGDRRDQCEEAAHDYMEARAARDSDRQTVSDTIGLMNASLRTLKEQLALRMQAGDSFDF